MAYARTLDLTATQHAALIQIRDHHPKASMRERAAALSNGASGMAVRQVARRGLRKPRRAETISDWITRYEQHGPDGLSIRDGHGRKPTFSPCPSGCGDCETGDPQADQA